MITALRPVPINEADALDMLRSLKSFKLLSGYRGLAPCDIQALVDAMIAVSDFAYDNRDRLVEMDVNPLFVYQDGVVAADALIVFAE